MKPIDLETLARPVLHGDRITLRPIVPEDGEAMFRSLSDEEAMRLTGTQQSFTVEEVKRHCASKANARNRIDYAIVVEGNLIGEVVINEIDPPNRSAGFRIAVWYPQNRDRGYGSEAARLVIDHAFRTLDLNRIELEVYAFNPRAKHVYEKLGFKVEGIRRQALWWGGEPVDAIIMAMLGSDYDEKITAGRRPELSNGD
jgi:RimJ/RimL family protein N-acetyltransferase